jgi:hypothetical protein
MMLIKGPGRSRVLWALLLSAALVGATVFGLDHSSSSAQQASATTVASTDSTDSTDTTAASDATDTTQASDSTDTTDTTVDDTTTTGANDQTTTTAAGDDNADANGNVKNLPVHDGTQKGNVFNETPYGEIPGSTPQIFIQRPGSGRILPLNTEIQVRARVQNFQPGFFNDPATQYGLEVQRLNANGDLQGHNHACAQLIPASGVLSDRCDSFVVLEQEGTTDIVSNVLPPLTKAGRYRICTDVAAGSHYVAARAFAQRGGPVDCVRVLVMPLRVRR